MEFFIVGSVPNSTLEKRLTNTRLKQQAKMPMSNDSDKSIDELLLIASDAWSEAVQVCPDRDLEADKNDPGNGPHCKHSGNESVMGWCECTVCPRADFNPM